MFTSATLLVLSVGIISSNGHPIDLKVVLPVTNGFAIALIGTALLITTVVALIACACCKQRRDGFKPNVEEVIYKEEFRNPSSSGRLGFTNNLSSELTLFPLALNVQQPSSQLVDSGGLSQIEEPLAPSRPAAFLDAVPSISDWFDPDLNFSRQQLFYQKELGKGWFGKVVKGEARSAKVVVKILREDANPEEKAYFLNEAKPFRDLKHKNISRLYGRCLEHDPFLLMFEYCTNGDLKSFLVTNSGSRNAITEQKISLKMMIDVTEGLKFMNEHNFIHTDIAARNCLVASDLTVKIGDYGTSVDKYKNEYYIAGDVAVPIRWCAPETLTCTQTTIETKEVTKAGNVWSLAVLLWEIAEFGKLPYYDLTDDEVITKVVINETVRLPPPNCTFSHYLHNVMALCWKLENRATIEHILQMLNYIISNPFQESEFDSRWKNLKPNTVPVVDNHTPIHSPRHTELAQRPHLTAKLEFDSGVDLEIKPCDENPDSCKTGTPNTVSPQLSVTSEEMFQSVKHKSPSLTNLKGSTEDVIQYDSWLVGVEQTTEEDRTFVKNISEAIKNLDETLAMEKTSSSSQDSSMEGSKKPLIEFKLGPTTSDKRSDSSSSDTEEETWRNRIERGEFTEKVKEKSKSVTDLMVLTHIDSEGSESDSLPSLTRQYSLKKTTVNGVSYTGIGFGSEGNIRNAVLSEELQDKLKQLSNWKTDPQSFLVKGASEKNKQNALKIKNKNTLKDENVEKNISVSNVSTDIIDKLDVNSKVMNVVNKESVMCYGEGVNIRLDVSSEDKLRVELTKEEVSKNGIINNNENLVMETNISASSHSIDNVVPQIVITESVFEVDEELLEDTQYVVDVKPRPFIFVCRDCDSDCDIQDDGKSSIIIPKTKVRSMESAPDNTCSVILGSCEEYTLDYFKGLKTTSTPNSSFVTDDENPIVEYVEEPEINKSFSENYESPLANEENIEYSQFSDEDVTKHVPDKSESSDELSQFNENSEEITLKKREVDINESLIHIIDVFIDSERSHTDLIFTNDVVTPTDVTIFEEDSPSESDLDLTSEEIKVVSTIEDDERFLTTRKEENDPILGEILSNQSSRHSPESSVQDSITFHEISDTSSVDNGDESDNEIVLSKENLSSSSNTGTHSSENLTITESLSEQISFSPFTIVSPQEEKTKKKCIIQSGLDSARKEDKVGMVETSQKLSIRSNSNLENVQGEEVVLNLKKIYNTELSLNGKKNNLNAADLSCGKLKDLKEQVISKQITKENTHSGAKVEDGPSKINSTQTSGNCSEEHLVEAPYPFNLHSSDTHTNIGNIKAKSLDSFLSPTNGFEHFVTVRNGLYIEDDTTEANYVPVFNMTESISENTFMSKNLYYDPYFSVDSGHSSDRCVEQDKKMIDLKSRLEDVMKSGSDYHLKNSEDEYGGKILTPDDEKSSDSGFRDKGSLSESVEDTCDEKYNLEDIDAELDEYTSIKNIDKEDLRFYEQLMEPEQGPSQGWYLHARPESKECEAKESGWASQSTADEERLNLTIDLEFANAIRNELKDKLPNSQQVEKTEEEASPKEEASSEEEHTNNDKFSYPSQLSPILEEQESNQSSLQLNDPSPVFVLPPPYIKTDMCEENVKAFVSLESSKNGVIIEDFDEHGIVVFNEDKIIMEDDVLIVDTETNKATLIESPKPRSHLAFVLPKKEPEFFIQADSPETISDDYALTPDNAPLTPNSTDSDSHSSPEHANMSGLFLSPCSVRSDLFDSGPPSMPFDLGQSLEEVEDMPISEETVIEVPPVAVSEDDQPIMNEEDNNDKESQIEIVENVVLDIDNKELLLDDDYCEIINAYKKTQENNKISSSVIDVISSPTSTSNLLNENKQPKHLKAVNKIDKLLSDSYKLNEQDQANLIDSSNNSLKNDWLNSLFSSNINVSGVTSLEDKNDNGNKNFPRKDWPSIDELIYEKPKEKIFHNNCLKPNITSTLALMSPDLSSADSKSLASSFSSTTSSSDDNKVVTLSPEDSENSKLSDKIIKPNSLNLKCGDILGVPMPSPEDAEKGWRPTICQLKELTDQAAAEGEEMTTSFIEPDENGIYTPDWESDISEEQSSSSGEFVWKEGDQEDLINIIGQDSNSLSEEIVGGMERIEEEDECSTSCDESDVCSEASSGTEFVPSTWNATAVPLKSALKTNSSQKKADPKKVVFKKEKYQCIYEYPREDSDSEEEDYSPSIWQTPSTPVFDYSIFSEWDIGGEIETTTPIEVLDSDNEENKKIQTTKAEDEEERYFYQMIQQADYDDGSSQVVRPWNDCLPDDEIDFSPLASDLGTVRLGDLRHTKATLRLELPQLRPDQGEASILDSSSHVPL